jgi:hypothetical protein
MVMTISAPDAASAPLDAALAPASVARATASAEMSNALTACPAAIKLATIGPPMFPSPINPIFDIAFSPD